MIEEKFDDLVDDLMKNPRFRDEYEALKPEFEAARAEIDAQTKNSAGMLTKYASPGFISVEKTAWADAAEKKYGEKCLGTVHQ